MTQLALLLIKFETQKFTIMSTEGATNSPNIKGFRKLFHSILRNLKDGHYIDDYITKILPLLYHRTLMILKVFVLE